jgi:hypothetical protein
MTNKLTPAALDELERMEKAATPAPWRWVLGTETNDLHIVAQDGHSHIVMDLVRWGMGRAIARFRDFKACMMRKATEYAKAWPNREHHAHWDSDVDHPDAQLMLKARNALPGLIAAARERDTLAEQLRQAKADGEALRTHLCEVRRQALKYVLPQLPSENQRVFVQMYARVGGRGSMTDAEATDIIAVVDAMPDTHLEWAMRQVQNTLRKLPRIPATPADQLLVADAEVLRQAFKDLVAESGGVYGLHQNGDPAPWSELCRGGRFEDWCGVFDDDHPGTTIAAEIQRKTDEVERLREVARKQQLLLMECDSELSAIAANRPADKLACKEMVTEIRQLAAALAGGEVTK